jgi:hypothetical protein
MTTLSRIASQWTVTPDAMPTPVSAPMRACVDDEGSPRRQVIRFHVMAPISPESTMISASWELTSPMLMMSSAIVVATCVPSRAPSRLNTAAMMRAARGVRARVDTDVAMAFAASWNPLV